MLNKIAQRAAEYPNETINFAVRSRSLRKAEKESSKFPGPRNKNKPAASRTQERNGICSSVIRNYSQSLFTPHPPQHLFHQPAIFPHQISHQADQPGLEAHNQQHSRQDQRLDVAAASALEVKHQK